VTLGTVIGLGVLATLNLLDIVHAAPWMGRRPVIQQVVFGGLGAFVVPVVLSLFWGRLWRAGFILGWTLAFLLHVTVAVVVVLAVYVVLEHIAALFDHRGPSIKANLGITTLSKTGGN
jgi:Na+/proline symporter